MALKKGPNFEEKLTLSSKNDMGNLVSFNASSGKSENLHSDGILLQEVYVMFELERYSDKTKVSDENVKISVSIAIKKCSTSIIIRMLQH